MGLYWTSINMRHIFCAAWRGNKKEVMGLKNVLEYLEQTAEHRGDEPAVDDGEVCYTWRELLELSKRIGSSMINLEHIGKPVPVVMDKSADTLAAFFGIVYAGNFYVLVNPEYPNVRIEKILKTLESEILLADVNYEEKIRACGYQGTIITVENAKEAQLQEEKLAIVRRQSTDQDILYGIFTSGSTGTPKAVIVNHRAVIDFIESFGTLFEITEQDIIGNQAPFDFDVSVKDIYTAMFTGAKLVLIPKHLFSMPPALIDYLCEKKVTVLIWAVSALCIITTLRGFAYRIPKDVKKVLFSGEIMPYQHLNAWQKALPGTEYINLYGPTEITCNCTYYRVSGQESKEKPLPVGEAFPNRRVFLLDDENRKIKEPEVSGEICVSGISLASGYYNNEEATKKSFVQNPLNNRYPETIYRTGDIGYYNLHGALCFSGRKDFQVKRMGHRIELEEIQLVIEQTEGVQRACCIYGEQENKLVAFYQGSTEKKEVRRKIKEQMPGFMIPDAFVQVPYMPLNKNGKIDREELMDGYREERKKR